MRNKALWKRLVIACAWVGLVGFAAWTSWRVYAGQTLKAATHRFEEQVGLPALSELAPPAIPDDQNAASWLLLAIGSQSHWYGQDWEGLEGWLAMDLEDLVGEEEGKARDLLARQRTILTSLHRMRGLSTSSFNLDYTMGAQMEIPNLLSVLQCSRLLVLEARLALKSGHQEEALGSLMALRSAVDALYEEPVMVFSLVGLATEKLLLSGVRDGVGAGLGEPSRWLALVRRPRAGDYFDIFQSTVQAEGALSHWMVDSYSAETYETFDSSSLVGMLPSFATAPAAWLDAAEALEYYRSTVDYFPGSSFSSLRDAGVLAGPRGGSSGASKQQVSDRTAPPWIPNLEAVVGRFKANEAIRRLAEIALEVAESEMDSSAVAGGNGWRNLREVDPFTGQGIQVVLSPAGATIVNLPQGADLWSEVFPQTSSTTNQLFRWVVPSVLDGVSGT